MNKSVLFVVNGFGMGNATRSDSLSELLGENYSSDILTSDRAFQYFCDSEKSSNVYKQADMGLSRNYKFGSAAYFINYVPGFIKRLSVNFFTQRKLISEKKYDFVIFDSDYSFILHRLFRTKTHLIGLNNALEVVSFFYRNPEEIKLKLLPSFVVELLDFACYALFCRFVICPSVSPEYLRPPFAKFLVAPLLARRQLLAPGNQKETSSQVLVMASSSKVKSPIYQLEKQGRLSHYYFLTNEFKTNNSELLLNSEVLICNAGQSSISECLYMNKHAYIIPIDRHAEQFVNSILAAEKGLNRVDDNSDSEVLTSEIENCRRRGGRPDYQYSYAKTSSIIKNHFLHIEQALA